MTAVHDAPKFDLEAPDEWPAVDLRAIERRSGRASLAPWVSEARAVEQHGFTSVVRIPYKAHTMSMDSLEDAEFVAHARDDIPLLLALVHKLAEDLMEHDPADGPGAAILRHIGKF